MKACRTEKERGKERDRSRRDASLFHDPFESGWILFFWSPILVCRCYISEDWTEKKKPVSASGKGKGEGRSAREGCVSSCSLSPHLSQVDAADFFSTIENIKRSIGRSTNTSASNRAGETAGAGTTRRRRVNEIDFDSFLLSCFYVA